MSSNNHQFGTPPDDVLASIRAAAFATVTPRTAAAPPPRLAHRVYREGHRLKLVDREIRVPADAVVVFEDRMPGANFGHPCRYLFHSPHDGRLLHREDALFPPEVADPEAVVEHFHAPLKVEVARPVVYRPIDLAKVHLHPWFVDDNRYALLFTSQISTRRHVEDVELAYRVLHHRFGFPRRNIFVLCYDGTIGATDATAADMATWIGDGTAYEMDVTAEATKANVASTLQHISGRMDSEGLLFVHTNNHGSPASLCVVNASHV